MLFNNWHTIQIIAYAARGRCSAGAYAMIMTEMLMERNQPPVQEKLI